MDSSLSLDHWWWLEFQPDVKNEKFFVFEHLGSNKSDASEEVLQSNSTRHSALKATQNGCGDDKLFSPIPTCTIPELTKCSNVQACGQNQIAMSQPLEVYEDESALKLVEKIQEEVKIFPVNNKLMDNTGLERSLNYYLHCTTAKSYNKGGTTWRQADQSELASIVAIKSAEHFQNCDLPPPQSVWLGCGPLKSSEKCEVTEISMGTSSGRSPGLEEKALNSLRLSGHSPPSSLVLEATESPAVQMSSSDHSQERTASTSCSDGNTETSETDDTKLDILEALRRSQTRAREAEKTAALTILENEKLVSLCIRESSHINFYRQWLAVLQIENSKLRWKLEVLQSEDQGSLICDSCEVSKKGKVVTRQDQCCLVNYQGRQCKKIKKLNAKRNGSWALAVTLGLSLATAGLVLGWSMGWIFPGY